MPKYTCTIHDHYQGDFTVTVYADSEDEAQEEAEIAAAENGCTHVDEIIVDEELDDMK